MDTTLAFTPKPVAATPYVTEREPPRDRKVPVVKDLDGAATLPSAKSFVAQVVNARLSGTEFPESPGKIAPAERTLRPYSTPMLPHQMDQSGSNLVTGGNVAAETTQSEAPTTPALTR